ncbi:MAG TPA: hypothetical protein ENJ82_13345, partial [Bacteroidetes bacterium]|nr:hypothetical protein [Bacteroidota bacterium]
MNIRVYLVVLFCMSFVGVHGQLYKKGKLMIAGGDTLTGLVAVQADNTFAYKKNKKAGKKL